MNTTIAVRRHGPAVLRRASVGMWKPHIQRTGGFFMGREHFGWCCFQKDLSAMWRAPVTGYGRTPGEAHADLYDLWRRR